MRFTLISLAVFCTPIAALAGPADFHSGPIIEEFGAVATIESAPVLPSETILKVDFDIAKAAPEGGINRSFDTAARFINMHAAAGLPLDQINVALVVHGPAASDLLAHDGNASAPLIAALIDAGATITLCGQTAAYRDIKPEDLLPGVTLSISAMTAHAQLQQAGYTLNPF